MSMTVKLESRRRTVLWIAVAVVFVLVSTGVLLYSDPAPPRTVRLATGEKGGAYARFGERFAERLRDWGLEVEIVYTKGSLENYERLSGGQRTGLSTSEGCYSPPEAL